MVVDHQKYILTLPVPTLVITEYKCVCETSRGITSG